MTYWASWFVKGWAILLGVLLGWELWGYAKRMQGDKSYPPLSNIIALIPWKVRDPVLIALALILIWHFHVVEGEQLRRAGRSSPLKRHA